MDAPTLRDLEILTVAPEWPTLMTLLTGKRDQVARMLETAGSLDTVRRCQGLLIGLDYTIKLKKQLQDIREQGDKARESLRADAADVELRSTASSGDPDIERIKELIRGFESQGPSRQDH